MEVKYCENVLKKCRCEKLKNICNVIFDKYTDNTFNVEKLASIVHLSRCYIHTLFTTYLDAKPIDVINNCRMLKAIELLKNNNQKIYNVAKQSGFPSSRTMNNVMRRKLQLNPTRLRKKLGKTNSDEILEEIILRQEII